MFFIHREVEKMFNDNTFSNDFHVTHEGDYFFYILEMISVGFDYL
jgi:hypothetical protein